MLLTRGVRTRANEPKHEYGKRAEETGHQFEPRLSTHEFRGSLLLLLRRAAARPK